MYSRSFAIFVVMVSASCAIQHSTKKDGTSMSESASCTITVGPDQDLNAVLREAPDDASVCLSPGVFRGEVVIRRRVRLLAPQGAVVMTARGSAVLHAYGDADVYAEGIVFRRGGGGVGEPGLVSVAERARVTLRNVTLEEGLSDAGGPGAIRVGGREVVLERCLVRRNRGNHAEAILVAHPSKLVLRDTVILGQGTDEPLINLQGSSAALIERSTLSQPGGKALEIQGSSFGAGHAEIRASVVNGKIGSWQGGHATEVDTLHDIAIDENGRPPGRTDVGPTPGGTIGAL